MQVVDKFIINRNDIRYIYVEHLCGNFNYSSYHVYKNSNDYECLSPNDFYLVYGDDLRLTIYEYINEVECLMLSYGDNNTRSYLNDLRVIKPRIKNTFNPSLWGCKSTLLTSVDYYNNNISDKVLKETYDYERDLNRLNEEDISDTMVKLREYLS